MDEAQRAERLVDETRQVLDQHKRTSRLLEDIGWQREVEEEFFAHDAQRLPKVNYELDRGLVEDRVKALQDAARRMEGDDLVPTFLRRVLLSQVDANRLIAARGTREFYECSKELYGSASSSFFGGETTNEDLADHVLERLKVHGWDTDQDVVRETFDAERLASTFREKIANRKTRMDVQVVVDPTCTAKVLAGMTRVRVRADARFTQTDVSGLWHHEVEMHSLTALNGAAQDKMPFLRSGGPRTTSTQEGLAVFSELYNRALPTARLRRLALRVKLVAMAERGADFLDVYRFLIERGHESRDAYLDAQRVFRGGLIEGGAPFTKDACYLSGLLHVYVFLSAFVRGGFRDETELLVCGRVALDDIAALVQLRSFRILGRPVHRPAWLRQWDTLLPYFSFTSFLDGVDIAPVEKHFRDLIDLARSVEPPQSQPDP